MAEGGYIHMEDFTADENFDDDNRDITHDDDFVDGTQETSLDYQLPELPTDDLTSIENRSAVLNFYKEVNKQGYKINKDAYLKNRAYFSMQQLIVISM